MIGSYTERFTVPLSELALGASRELGEEEDGAITEDAEGLRIWVGDDAFELIVQK
jgi:hypothetical protein